MNCKPGDLAVIVRRSPKNLPSEDAYIGAMLRVVSINAEGTARWSYKGHTVWNFEPLSSILESVRARTILDYSLRPIRDAGDDATDETLLWLPVPHKEPA